MAAYQKGDVPAFATLVARHEKPLWNFLRRFVTDTATAEDLLQETFLRVVKGAGGWKADAKFSTWLYTIARNLCTDHARRAVFRQAASLDGDSKTDDEDFGPRPMLDRISGADRGGENAAMDRQTAARIDAAVGTLPVEQREVFLMREVMDMPFAEIARAVSASEPTVKSRMRYALERLREGLAEMADGAATTAAAGQTGERP